MTPRDLLKQRFGGSWDGDAPELHGLLTLGRRRLKVELLYVCVTDRWQCCVFEDGACLALGSAEDLVEAAAHALAEAMRQPST